MKKIGSDDENDCPIISNKRKRSVTFPHTEDKLNDQKTKTFVRGLCKEQRI